MRDQTTIMAGDRPKDSHGLARGRMQHDRIALFRWHPHQTSGAMLLKMAFVFKPKVNSWVLGQAMEFFYMPVALAGQHGQ